MQSRKIKPPVFNLKNFLLILVLILVTFHAFWLPLRQFPYTHDGENHLARFANYKIALKEGQLPPRFAPNLLNHYGYPVFNYNYPLANILSLPLSFLRLNYESSFKLITFAWLIFGAFGVLVWLRQLLAKKFNFGQKALLLTAYLANPYIINLVYFRGSIGEISVYGLLPWLFFIIDSFAQKRSRLINWSSAIFPIAIFSAFFLAHNVSVLVGVFVLGAWALFSWSRQGWRRLWWRLRNFFFTILLPSLGLTLWFWLPALAEMNQVVIATSGLQKAYLLHFARLSELIYSPLQFGFSYPGQINSLSFWLGWINLGALLLAFGLALSSGLKQPEKNQRPPGWFWFFTGLSFSLLFLMTWWSKPIWQKISFLRFIQFPWRLALWWALASLPLIAWLLTHLKKGWLWFLLIVAIAQYWLVFQARPLSYFHHQNLDYELYGQSTSTKNENMPQTFKYLLIGDWQPAPHLLDGQGKIKVNHWSGSQRDYQLDLVQPSLVVEPTMNFLGWQTEVKSLDRRNQSWRHLEYVNNDQIQGRIAYQLDKGSWLVRTRFTQRTWAREWGNTIFWLTLISLTMLFIKYYHSENDKSKETTN